MNSTPATQFEAAYTPELIEDATRTFVSHHFRHQGRWLVAACIVNALGFGVALWLGAKGILTTALIGFMVAVGPLYCIYLFTLFPRRYASRVSRFLVPTALVSLNVSALEISAKGRNARVPWASVKEVLALPAYFLLVISPFAMMFAIVPRAGIPSDVHEVLAQRARQHVA